MSLSVAWPFMSFVDVAAIDASLLARLVLDRVAGWMTDCFCFEPLIIALKGCRVSLVKNFKSKLNAESNAKGV